MVPRNLREPAKNEWKVTGANYNGGVFFWAEMNFNFHIRDEPITITPPPPGVGGEGVGAQPPTYSLKIQSMGSRPFFPLQGRELARRNMCTIYLRNFFFAN